MSDFELPPDDEPFDFRRQAATYGRFRRDYSAALYDAIEAHTGPGAGRAAVDLGCGTGFVLDTLARRGWRAVGVDVSAPMLAAAHAASPTAALVRGRGEALPFGPGVAALVAVGTAFHWMAPAPTVAEMARVLRPTGHAALFWRLSRRDGAPMRLVAEVLARLGIVVPDGLPGPLASRAVFEGSGLEVEAEVCLETTLVFSADEFHGFVATVEWLRRLAGTKHDQFLTRLHAELAARFPDGVRDPTDEWLIVARRA